MEAIPGPGFWLALVSVLSLSACDMSIRGLNVQELRIVMKLDPVPAQPPPASSSGEAPPQTKPAIPPPQAGTDVPQPPSSESHESSPAPNLMGERCLSRDPEFLCLGLKYVIFQNNAEGSDPLALPSLNEINQVWKPCEIGFQVDEYLPVEPKKYRLKYNISAYSELTRIRKSFSNDHSLLVVTTGKWDRRGSLGNTGANAWTNLPGEGLYGVVLEAPVCDNENIIAHELGHYLSLDHENDRSNLMNPIIHAQSDRLTRTQCKAARQAVREFWPKMVRRQS